VTLVTATWPSVEAAEKAELTVLAMYNRAGKDAELREDIIQLANVLRGAINEAKATDDPSEGLI